MTLIDGYEPVIDPVRFVSYAKKKDFRRKRDRMQALGVISPTEVPTEFVNSVVMTTNSNGDVRVCLDPKGLNKALVREHHHIKTREEICAALAGAKFFTQLDLRSAFWQIPLDQESRKLTTFGTPFDRYHYNVLPFDLKPASEICQKRFEDEMVCGAPDSYAHQDNILIVGRSVHEHDKNLKAILDNASEVGIKFRLDKCEFRVTETIFLEERLTGDGIKPDPTKIKAVLDIGDPSNKEELQSILGMINFFSKFVPNLAAKTRHMRTLLTRGSVWSWDANQEDELSHVKVLLTCAYLI